MRTGFQRILVYLWWFGPSQRDCYKGKGKRKGFSNDGGYGQRLWQGKACFWCGSTEHVIKDGSKDTNVQQVEEDVPEILLIGNVQNKEALEGWKKMPMKV